jgi:hypothetical protein
VLINNFNHIGNGMKVNILRANIPPMVVGGVLTSILIIPLTPLEYIKGQTVVEIELSWT